MVRWLWRSFDALSTQELYDILALRQDVFVIEQQCKDKDLDYFDQKALHLLGIQNNQLVAYLRLFQPDIIYPGATTFGRVLTAASARGQGIGKEAIQQTLLHLKANGNSAPITISAQLYLQKFYESFGFEVISEPYDEAGLPHIKMRRQGEHDKKS